MTERALLLCPGRGSYTSGELGWLQRPVPAARRPELERILERIDARRHERGDTPVREMDAADRFRQEFLRGENAAALIFACTAHDLLALDDHRVRIVAVGGNSMGWYSALWVAGALELDDTLELVETMGGMLREGTVGGQVIYPTVDERWQGDDERRSHVAAVLDTAREEGRHAGFSIRFGGFAVLWADDDSVEWLLERLDGVTLGDRQYPLRLPGNSAFHSPLMEETSERGHEALSGLGWRRPDVPLIDGRGGQWRPLTAGPDALRRYTLETQVLTPYDFAATVRVGLREYAPDRIVLLGPGDTLGAAVAQTLIAEGWQGIHHREAFLERQADDPLVVSLARPDQARHVLASATVGST